MANVLNNEQRFSIAPAGVEMNRSTLDRSCGWKGTSIAGKLNCCFVDEVLPGDTIDMKVNSLTRMTTPVFPVLDNCFLDVYFFFVPMRLTWSHTKEFFGENTSTSWIPSTTYTIPMYDMKTYATRAVGDLGHQMGIPYTVATVLSDVNALPFRAYHLIWSEWFRDQNTQNPALVNIGDTETDTSLFTLRDVCRIHDYFGSCLPAPQKGNTVNIPLNGIAWVTPQSSYVPAGNFLNKSTTTNQAGVHSPNNVLKVNTSGQVFVTNNSTYNTTNFDNLGVDFDNATLNKVGLDVNSLRESIATQRILEKFARSGSRYTETIRSFFGVTSPDARQQRPELLGCARWQLNMADVTQNSATVSGQTPIGTIAGVSKTANNGCAFNHSFTEHGYILGLFTVRHNRSYSQGIAKMWKRKDMLDFYFPQLAHLGEQPVMKSELYAGDVGTSGADEVFGYQEAWADMRYKPSICTGLLDPAVPNTIGTAWTYTDLYSGVPSLSGSWMKEGSTEIARTLAVQNEDQFIHDFWFDFKETRVMPVYSVPGLADHF